MRHHPDPKSPTQLNKQRLEKDGWETELKLTPEVNSVRTFKLPYHEKSDLGLHLINLQLRVPCAIKKGSDTVQRSYCCIVYAVRKNSEARLQGFCPGDIIVKLGGADIQGMTFASILNLLTRKPNSGDSKYLEIQVRYIQAHKIYDLVNEKQFKMAAYKMKEQQLAAAVREWNNLLEVVAIDRQLKLLGNSSSAISSTISRLEDSPCLPLRSYEAEEECSRAGVNSEVDLADSEEPTVGGWCDTYDYVNMEGDYVNVDCYPPMRHQSLDEGDLLNEEKTEEKILMREHTGPCQSLFLQQQHLRFRQSLLCDDASSFRQLLTGSIVDEETSSSETISSTGVDSNSSLTQSASQLESHDGGMSSSISTPTLIHVGEDDQASSPHDPLATLSSQTFHSSANSIGCGKVNKERLFAKNTQRKASSPLCSAKEHKKTTFKSFLDGTLDVAYSDDS